MGRPDAAVLVRRAISVQLATIDWGQPRLLQSTRTGRSAAHTGEATLLPKLTVLLLRASGGASGSRMDREVQEGSLSVLGWGGEGWRVRANARRRRAPGR
jgi:hypothetical protein